ncbi:MAG: HlyD family efflux transporter periplasmic adaptor subunit [Acidobacteriota bacterium]
MLPALLVGCAGQPHADTASFDDIDGDSTVIRRGPLHQTLLLTGELRSVGGAEIVVPDSPQREPVIRWMIEEGTRVEPDDRMVELDTSSIASQLDSRQISLEEAINELNNRAAEIDGERAQSEFEVEQARISLRKAEIDASVPQDLQSLREYQEAQLALEQAQNNLAKVENEYDALVKGSEDELEVMRIEVQMAQRDVAEVQRALETMVLRAPRAGLAVAGDNRREGRKFQVGDTTWVGAELMVIPDLSEMIVDTRMSDVDDGKVTPGMQVWCTLDAYPEHRIEGYVRSITPVAQWLNMRSEQRFFRIIVDLEESDPEIMRPGMSVKVEVVTASSDDELLVPRKALEFGTTEVFAVLENGERRQVELGSCDAQACAVRQGLSEGDRVQLHQQ